MKLISYVIAFFFFAGILTSLNAQKSSSTYLLRYRTLADSSRVAKGVLYQLKDSSLLYCYLISYSVAFEKIKMRLLNSIRSF